MTSSAADALAGQPGPGPRWLGDLGQAALAALLALVLLPVGVRSVREGDVGTGWTVTLLGALVVLHLAVVVARRRPVASYAVGAGAMLVLVTGPDLSGLTANAAGGAFSPVLLPSSLCFFPLLYAVSARGSRPWPTIALGVALIGCLLTVVRIWSFSVPGLEWWTWRLILTTAMLAGTLAAWALGRFRATREAWIAELADRGAADERRRIAREMHDVVAHSLAVVVSHAEAGRLVVARDPDRAPEILGTIADAGRGALTEMRGLLGVLRDEAGSNAPQPGLDELPGLVAGVRAAGLEVAYDDAALPEARPPATVGLTAYRVAQEALTNVTRHAGPGARARVVVAREGTELVVEVTDNGAGPGAFAGSPGRGLIGMRERVEAVGGVLKAGPDPREGTGWRVHARLPWGEEDSRG
ncbi:sensor histidine kinase [Nocardioides gansuensis]|uniref:histidine kinase n=1 Tax=Nocardioides gansuensis TaxID=2138300 RepID=A0A2T8F7Z1_9ACTN|nr:sensor histidine kinase [Nocardioides gansuensis]